MTTGRGWSGRLGAYVGLGAVVAAGALAATCWAGGGGQVEADDEATAEGSEEGVEATSGPDAKLEGAASRLADTVPAGVESTVHGGVDGMARRHVRSWPRQLACLREAYPRAIEEISREDGDIRVHLRTGQTVPWDDGRQKTHLEKFRNPDLQDTFYQPYRTGPLEAEPLKNEEPGRIRHTRLLKAAYGVSAGAVYDNLVQVDWPGVGKDRRLRFNRRNGAAEALRRVAAELRALDSKYRKYFETTAGTFNWRNIRGTDQRSAHSFAVAVDLNTEHADYWRWRDRTHPIDYRNRIPLAVVEAFEAHGFVWGGKWYRFDTMHFEYRPAVVGCGPGRSTSE